MSLVQWGRRNWEALTIGALLLVLPIPVGSRVLSVKVPESKEPSAVGFVPPVLPRKDRGIAMGLAAIVTSCGEPVDVVLVVAGTSEYWVDNRRRLRGRPSRFRLALPGVLGGRAEVRAGSAATNVTDPLEVLETRPNGSTARLTIAGARRAPGDLTIIRGSIPDWPRSLAPIVARFRAAWLEKTGLGSCIIRLPALEGDFSVLAAQEARGRAKPQEDVYTTALRVVSAGGRGAAYRASLEPTLSSATVVVKGGHMDAENSLPNPTATVHGSPTWTCEIPPKRTARVFASDAGAADMLVGNREEGSAGAISKAEVRHGPTRDCSAVVAVVEASAARKRDIIILVIGAVIGLGAAILIELGLGHYRERQGAD